MRKKISKAATKNLTKSTSKVTPELEKQLLQRSGSAFVTRGDIVQNVNEQVDELFGIFDQDGSGEVNKGPELTFMISELQKKGYTFGKLVSDDGKSSIYAPKTSKRIKSDVLRNIDDPDPESGISRDEFTAWFFSFVISRKSNLRVLLHGNKWMLAAIDKVFKDHGNEGVPAETVGPEALDEPLIQIAESLGEPPPPPDALQKFLHRADASGDGELSPMEFRYVLVEVTTWLFHAHFNDSMHPHQQFQD